MMFWVGTGAVIILSTALVFFLPRPSATQWYTSPPIDAKGTRLKLRVPINYRFQYCDKRTGNTELRYSPDIPDFLMLVMPSGRVHISVIQTAVPDPKANTPSIIHSSPGVNDACFTCFGISKAALRIIYVPSLKYEIRLSYDNDDVSVFERNYKEIMDSLTIVQSQKNTPAD